MKNNNLNFITPARIKLMWESDRWDVPLAGILKLDNKKICFFKRAHHPTDAEEGIISYEDKEYNRYDVFELKPDEVKYELRVHDCFVRYVGSHIDAIDNKLSSLGGKAQLIRPQLEHTKFYSKYPISERREYKNNKYLGSFYMTNGVLNN